MSGSRWLALLTLVAVIALGASSASAQVFRPRNGKAPPVSKAALAAAATPAPATAKKTGADAAAPAASSAKKAARPAEGTPRHAQSQGNQGNQGKTKKRGKHRNDSDDVKIDDDDDEDVKITDD